MTSLASRAGAPEDHVARQPAVRRHRGRVQPALPQLPSQALAHAIHHKPRCAAVGAPRHTYWHPCASNTKSRRKKQRVNSKKIRKSQSHNQVTESMCSTARICLTDVLDFKGIPLGTHQGLVAVSVAFWRACCLGLPTCSPLPPSPADHKRSFKPTDH